MKNNKIAFLFYCIIVISISIGINSCKKTKTESIEELICDQLGSKRLTVGREMKEWIYVLGKPMTVQQSDSGHTFFFWPEKGIGIFCHPLYHSQYAHKQMKEWIVTSVIIPLKDIIHPDVVPIDTTLMIGFKKLLLEESDIFDIVKEKDARLLAHKRGENVEFIELQLSDSWYGEYD